MKFQVGDKVRVVYGNKKFEKGVVLQAFDDSRGEDYIGYVIGITEPKNFRGHCGYETNRQKYNWHNKCWVVSERHLEKVV